MHQLDQLALETIAKGSKSFSLAAKFFPREEMINAARIYSWCRHCDDVIDEGNGDEANLLLLEEKTKSAWEENTCAEFPFLALKRARESCLIPPVYALDLLKGMEMDLKGTTYQTLSDLLLYCYRVASTVGLMMCHVMGLFRISALEKAAKLGMAMQLTNISRDVKTDFEMGRNYLPVTWLLEEGMTEKNYFAPENRERLYKVVTRLIDESESLYKEGLEGIADLPVNSALTILIAGKIYREIGRAIKRKGVAALESRTVVSRGRKLLLILSALLTILLLLPGRFLKRKKLVPITETWTYA